MREENGGELNNGGRHTPPLHARSAQQRSMYAARERTLTQDGGGVDGGGGTDAAVGRHAALRVSHNNGERERWSELSGLNNARPIALAGTASGNTVGSSTTRRAP